MTNSHILSHRKVTIWGKTKHKQKNKKKTDKLNLLSSQTERNKRNKTCLQMSIFFFLNEWPSAVSSDRSCCDIVVTGLIILGFTSLSFVMFQSELVIKTNKALFFLLQHRLKSSCSCSCAAVRWVSLLSGLVLLKHGLDKWFDLNKGKLHIDWEP